MLENGLDKFLKNPKVIGTELGHDSILEIINLIQNSGLVQKPKVQPKKDKHAEKQLIKFALEESPVPIVRNPIMKKAIAADNDPAAGAKYIDWWDRL